SVASTGNHWCAYPDPVCPSGYRFSDHDVGDGVSGSCVAQTDTGVDGGSDAGVDAPVDAPVQQPAQSCIALPHTCGAAGTDDCCNSPMVTGGTFFRGYDAAGSGDMSAPA